MTESATDWPEVGMLVAEYRSGHAQDWVGFTTIDRLTATQIVLSNDRRYNRKTLRLVGQTGAWTQSTLERADSPRVVRTVTMQIIKGALHDIDRIARDNNIQGMAILDEAERLIQNARTEIANIGKVKK